MLDLYFTKGTNMIDLYTAATPNGWKASVSLEEMGLDYNVKAIDISTGDQRKPGFLKINPNGRIPAIVDHDIKDENGDGFAVFESGALMIYLAEKNWDANANGCARPLQGHSVVDVSNGRYRPDDGTSQCVLQIFS